MPSVAGTFFNVNINEEEVYDDKVEKGQKLIIRLLNTSEKTKRFSLNVYGLEEPIKLSIKGYELITVAVKKSKKNISYSLVNLVEEK